MASIVARKAEGLVSAYQMLAYKPTSSSISTVVLKEQETILAGDTLVAAEIDIQNSCASAMYLLH